MKVKINCKHCRRDIKTFKDKEIKEYYCAIGKMEDDGCPENCEWFIPSRVYVI